MVSTTLGQLGFNAIKSNLEKALGDGNPVTVDDVRALRPVLSLAAVFKHADKGLAAPTVIEELGYVAANISKPIPITPEELAIKRGYVTETGEPLMGWRARAIAAEHRIHEQVDKSAETALKDMKKGLRLATWQELDKIAEAGREFVHSTGQIAQNLEPYTTSPK